MKSAKNSDYQIEVREKLMPKGNPDYSMVLSGLPIFAIKDKIGLKETAKIMACLIARFVGNFNIIANMNPNQISDYAITLVEESPQLGDGLPAMRLEDFALFFEIAKTGKYGRPYDHVDAILIDEWLDQYFAERMERLRELAKDPPILPSNQKLLSAGEVQYVTAERMREGFKPIIEKLLSPDTSNSEKERAEFNERRKEMIDRQKDFFNGQDPDILPDMDKLRQQQIDAANNKWLSQQL